MSGDLNNILETKTEHPKVGNGNSGGGVEDSLSVWGTGFLVLGILSGVICIYAAGVVTKRYSFESWGDNGVAWYLVIVGVAAILQGMFVRVLLEAGAEIIRLLRKLNRK
jgi:hypothetical protein